MSIKVPSNPNQSMVDDTVHKARKVLGNELLEPSDFGMRKAETGVKSSVPAEHSLGLPSTVVLMCLVTPVHATVPWVLRGLCGSWGRDPWGECFSPELVRARHPHRIRAVGVVAGEE